MSGELVIHLVIDLVITLIILYYIKDHIKHTEDFYSASQEEWKRREEFDKRMEQRLIEHLQKNALENKQKISQMIEGRKPVKMYLDDLRSPKEDFDFIVRSYDEAITIISLHGVPDFISFDHDLGCDMQGKLLKDGYDLAKWLVESDLDKKYKLPSNFRYEVHSQNPIGKQNIISLLDGYLKHKNNLAQNKQTKENSNTKKENMMMHYLSNMSNYIEK